METFQQGNGERNTVKVVCCVRRGEHVPAHVVGRFLPYVDGVTPVQGARENRVQGKGGQVTRPTQQGRHARCGAPKPFWASYENVAD